MIFCLLLDLTSAILQGRRKMKFPVCQRIKPRANRAAGQSFAAANPQRGFTLIEMMLVIVIVGVLLAITLPLLQKLTLGSGANAGITMMASELRLARRYALTKRKRIAVILPGPNATSANVTNRYGCIRLAYVNEKNPPNLYQFDSWLEDSQWSFMPNGISIMECDDDVGIANGASFTKEPADNNFTKIDGVPLTSIGGNVQDGIRVVVFSSTGKVLGSSRYVTVGEAAFTGTVWIIRKPENKPKNKSTANQVTIEMDLYTGNFTTKNPTEY